MPTVHPRIVYARQYNIRFFGAERLHPFDSCKYGRVWRALNQQFGGRMKRCALHTPRPVNVADLLAVHSVEYLAKLRQSRYLAGALEIPQLSKLPAALIRHAVLRPMRWASMGTIVAARASLTSGLAINLSGGYHHASRERGEGFCIYSDIGLAIHALRSTGDIIETDHVLYIDIDAHQGNGVCRIFANDSRVMIFDMYNKSIYPADPDAKRRIDCDVPLPFECDGQRYLASLKSELPRFIDAVSRTTKPRLAIVNAGTDIVAGDLIGNLSVSPDDVLTRDTFVIDQLVERGIPTVMLLSGGYTRESHQLVTNSVADFLRRWPE